MAQLTVLITGCSEGGIGHSLALEFARQNYHVFATARNDSKMSSMSGNLNVTLLELDVISPKSIQTAVEAVSNATNGSLNILYHNAGVLQSLWRSTATGTWLNGHSGQTSSLWWNLTRVFMPLILNSGAGSKIVFSNSVAAVAPIPTQVLYDASKAALDMYTKVLRLEARPLGVHVVNVMTGEVGTTTAEQTLEKLPEGSPYESIASIINKSWTTRKTVMLVGKYSAQAVAKISQKNPPRQLWLGGNATTV
ncbi:short-chain dehydrogenase/reductase-like protein [Rhexocercosporidium sp. MPI-PUGE-AT-0058]|nr:short-chain dehydrogenase/reductase-like protein [Rhexocercosporidium sp. MPI-PUGE-AT-0058]